MTAMGFFFSFVLAKWILQLFCAVSTKFMGLKKESQTLALPSAILSFNRARGDAFDDSVA